MNIKDTIQNKLEEHIEVKYIEISDTTGRHVNHHNFDEFFDKFLMKFLKCEFFEQ